MGGVIRTRLAQVGLAWGFIWSFGALRALELPNELSWIPLVIACLVIPISRPENFRLPGPLLALFALSVVSVNWATDPSTTRLVLEATLPSLFGLTLLSCFLKREEVGAALTFTTWCVVAVTATALVLDPTTRRDPGPGAQGYFGSVEWHGLFDHGNNMAEFMVCAIPTVLVFQQPGMARRFLLTALAALIAGSTSRSGLVAALGAVVMWVFLTGNLPATTSRLFEYRRPDWQRILLWTLAGIAVATAAAGLMALGPNEYPLSRRTSIWAAAARALARRPLLGYGYGALLNDPDTSPVSSEIWQDIGFEAWHAHNGPLDLALQLGLIGLVIYAAQVLLTTRRTVRLTGADSFDLRVWSITLITVGLLLSIFEDSLLGGWFVVFVVISSQVHQSTLEMTSSVRSLGTSVPAGPNAEQLPDSRRRQTPAARPITKVRDRIIATFRIEPTTSGHTVTDRWLAAAQWSFVAAIALSPFRARFGVLDRVNPPIYVDYTSFFIFWADIPVLVTLMLWAVVIARRRETPVLRPAFLTIPAGLLILAAWAGVITSTDPPLSAYTSLRLSVLALFALFVMNEIRDWRIPVRGATLMVIGQVVVAIGQSMSQRSVGLAVLGEHVIDPQIPGVSTITSMDGDLLLRAYGLADHPNILGGLLAFGLLVLIGGLASASDVGRLYISAALAFGSLGLALTFSRGAVVAAAVGFVVSIGLLRIVRRSQDTRWWIAGGLVAMLALSIAVLAHTDFYTARTNVETFSQIDYERRTLSSRQSLMAATNDLIIENPALGTGAGAITVAMKERFPDFWYDYQPAHVVALTVAAEIGLFGVLAYLLLITGPWVVVWSKRLDLRPQLVAASALLAAVSVVGLFDYYTWSYAPGQFWFWTSLGLWAAMYGGPNRA